MTKRSLLVIALLLGLAVDSHAMTRLHRSTSAPDRVGRTDVGIGVAQAFNDQVDDAAFLSGTLTYGVTPYIAIGVEAGWQEADGTGSSETIGYIPVLADIVFRLPTVHEALVPYAMVGLGGAGVYAETNRADVDDTGFAWKLGAGLDYFLNPQWIFNLEIAYWNVDVNLPGTSLSSGDSEFWTLGAAIKYLF